MKTDLDARHAVAKAMVLTLIAQRNHHENCTAEITGELAYWNATIAGIEAEITRKAAVIVAEAESILGVGE